MTTIDEKYVVFKRDEFLKCMNALMLEVDGSIVHYICERQLDDAVVIRRRDVFAPPALDAYANSINVTIEALRTNAQVNVPLVERLRRIADYFHNQAVEAWNTDRKIPD